MGEAGKTGIAAADGFCERHLGPSADDVAEMVKCLGYESLDALTSAALPDQIKLGGKFSLSRFQSGLCEAEALKRLAEVAEQNQVWRSYLGMGYHGTVTPAVIRRNILENPGWYTQYTPYQPEISQGRLEALLNFQTLVCDLTGFGAANASLLDEGTAAAEAMHLSCAVGARKGGASGTFLVSEHCHPQTIAVVKTRAAALGVQVVVADHRKFVFEAGVFGVLVQYPDTLGRIFDYRGLIESAHKAGALVTVAADPLALVMLKPPAELGADIAVGSMQRFGVPMGYGGPHAAYFAARVEFMRMMPGRLVGVSKDAAGRRALRLALQTREQHIRREKATSNICTSQVLLAIMAGMYAVYHGPQGLRRIAARVHALTCYLARQLKARGVEPRAVEFFDTLAVTLPRGQGQAALERAKQKKINLRRCGVDEIAISLDETVTESDVADLVEILTGSGAAAPAPAPAAIPAELARRSDFLTAPVFNRFRSETEFQRYVRRLESRDLSLCAAMIPLGSCTMKLNAAAEMLPITWPAFAGMHPFAPREQAQGYQRLFEDLEVALAEITGFKAVSLQPNAGSQGEYAGLLVVRAYQRSRGEARRDICLIPKSAHGTNPASAAMAGLEVVSVACDEQGNIDIADLKAKAAQHRDTLAALMVTYPSTHGVFEEGIREICAAIHDCGGQVYMDGANLNALVGLARPGELGADVLHINLHKTFAIPHGGGGPGMGPIAVAAHLAEFLPNHPVLELGHRNDIEAVSAAPWGSAGILPISWMYMALMGADGLRRASQTAILNANYIAKRLEGHYPLVYRGRGGLIAHECIIDLHELKISAGVEVDDVAKRLMDYGFHAPTVSWPVPGTMMVEPTESESRQELDRFCDAMISIREEARQIEKGRLDRDNNPLKRAPHTAFDIAADEWGRPYSREQAAYPTEWSREYKFWPAVGRIDNVYGDRNPVCSCS
jgi:glycine dehydrogenase